MGTSIRTGTHGPDMQLHYISGLSQWWGVFYDSSTDTLYLYKDLGGTPTLSDSESATDIFGGGYTGGINAIDSQIDSGGDIWVVCSPDDIGGVHRFRKYDTGTEAWAGSWATVIPSWAETDGTMTNTYCSICVDTSNYIGFLYVSHLKYKGVTYSLLYFRYWNGSSLSAPELVSGAPNHDYTKSSVFCRGSFSAGDVDAVYVDLTDSDLNYRNRNAGSWGTENTFSNGAPGNFIHSLRYQIYDGAVYRYTMDSSGNIYQNDSDTAENGALTISAAEIADNRYLVGPQNGDQTRLDVWEYVSSWTRNATEQDETNNITSVATAYCYNNDVTPTDEVAYLYIEDGDILFDVMALAASANGSLSVTDAADTLAGTGTVDVAGSLTETEAADTLAGTGTVDVAGALAETQEDDSLAGVASAPAQGALSEIDEDDAIAGTSSAAASGALSETDEDDTIAASGVIDVAAVLNETQEDDALAGTGSVDVTAALGVTAGADTLAGVGAVDVTAVLSVIDAADTLAGTASGLVISLGALNVTEADDTLAGLAEVDVAGALAETDEVDTLAGVGSAPASGALSETDESDTLAGTGTVSFAEITAQLNQIAESDALAGTGVVYVEGALSEIEAADLLAGLAGVQVVGILAVTDGDDLLVGLGSVGIVEGILPLVYLPTRFDIDVELPDREIYTSLPDRPIYTILKDDHDG